MSLRTWTLALYLTQIAQQSLILTHVGGWQIDQSTVAVLLDEIGHAAALLEGGADNDEALVDDQEVPEVHVFNRDFIDADLHDLDREVELAVEIPDLGERLPDYTPSMAVQFVDYAAEHLARARHLHSITHGQLHAIATQRRSLEVALSNLDRHREGKQGGVDAFQLFASPQLESFESALSTYHSSLQAIGKLKVFPTILSSYTNTGSSTPNVGNNNNGRLSLLQQGRSASSNSTAKERERFLGDYVAKDKMAQIYDNCSQLFSASFALQIQLVSDVAGADSLPNVVHFVRLTADLQARSKVLSDLLKDVEQGAEQLRIEFGQNDIRDLDDCARDADEALARTEHLDMMVRKDSVVETARNDDQAADISAELSAIEAEAENRINYLIDRRREMMREHISTLQRIAHLQSKLSDAPNIITSLEADLTVTSAGSSSGLAPTAGFKHLSRLQRLIPAYCTTLADIVRRREYGRLLATSTADSAERWSALTKAESKRRIVWREEWTGYLPWEIRGMESMKPPFAEVDIRGTRDRDGFRGVEEGLPNLTPQDLLDLDANLETIEATLTKEDMPAHGVHPVVEGRTILATQKSKLDSIVRDFERTDEIRSPDDDDDSDEREMSRQVRLLEETNHNLERDLQTERSIRETEQAESSTRIAHVEALLDKARAESTKARTLAANSERQLRQIISGKDRDLDTAQADAAEHAKRADDAETQLAQMRLDHSTVLQDFHTTQASLREMEERFEGKLRHEREQSEAAVAARDEEVRTLRSTLASEIAVLKTEVDRLTSERDASENAKKEGRAKIGTLEDQLRERERQISDIQRERDAKISDIDIARHETEAAMIQARKALQLASSLYDFNRAVSRNLLKHSKSSAIVSMAESSEIDQSAPDWDNLSVASLDSLQAGMRIDQIKEALESALKKRVEGLYSAAKKWQKDSKHQKERAVTIAGEKITFRRFAVGDLALFLPTRNTSAQIWAAFNHAYPHYFLHQTPPIAEQVNSGREWLIARITGLTESVVEGNAASASASPDNPFALPVGTKYTLCDVELWTPPQRKKSATATSGPGEASQLQPLPHQSSAPADPIKADAGDAVQQSATEDQLDAEKPVDDAQRLAQSTFTVIESVSQTTSALPLPAQAPSARSSSPSNLTKAIATSPVERYKSPHRTPARTRSIASRSIAPSHKSIPPVSLEETPAFLTSAQRHSLEEASDNSPSSQPAAAPVAIRPPNGLARSTAGSLSASQLHRPPSAFFADGAHPSKASPTISTSITNASLASDGSTGDGQHLAFPEHQYSNAAASNSQLWTSSLASTSRPQPIRGAPQARQRRFSGALEDSPFSPQTLGRSPAASDILKRFKQAVKDNVD